LYNIPPVILHYDCFLSSQGLADEIKERIEQNKRLALERREARLKGRTPGKTGTGMHMYISTKTKVIIEIVVHWSL
jgi:hypothetical protein